MNAGYSYWVNYEISGEKRYLNEAIRTTEIPLGLDKRILEKNERTVLQLKNNLAYYYAERGEEEDLTKAKQFAEEIYHKVSEYPERKKTWIETYDFVKKKIKES